MAVTAGTVMAARYGVLMTHRGRKVARGVADLAGRGKRFRLARKATRAFLGLNLRMTRRPYHMVRRLRARGARLTRGLPTRGKRALAKRTIRQTLPPLRGMARLEDAFQRSMNKRWSSIRRG
jgi:hypothetical protein